MKKVLLKNYSKDKEYSVYLGNGTIHKFGSKQDTQQFLNITSRFLTLLLYESRNIHKEVFLKYHQCWGYFEHNKSSMNSSLRESDRHCYTLLTANDNHFDLIVNRCHWTNGNYHVFLHFNCVIKNLSEVLQNLHKLSRRQSSTSELYEYDSIYKRLQSLKTDMENYGVIQAKNLFVVPQHIDYEKEFIPITKLKIA